MAVCDVECEIMQLLSPQLAVIGAAGTDEICAGVSRITPNPALGDSCNQIHRLATIEIEIETSRCAVDDCHIGDLDAQVNDFVRGLAGLNARWIDTRLSQDDDKKIRRLFFEASLIIPLTTT